MTRTRSYEFGVILLFVQIIHRGADAIPPVTLGLVLLQTLLYMNIIRKPWTALDVCISAHTVWQGDWKRLMLSTVEHDDDMHLYYNMVSLLLKGSLLEKTVGLIKFLTLVCFLTLLTSIYYVLLSYVTFLLTNDENHLSHCAIGFSGVLFAMKTILTRNHPETQHQILSIDVKGIYAPWFELFIIYILTPNSSLKGHLSGILVGLTYTDTCVGRALDYMVSLLQRGANEDEQRKVNEAPSSTKNENCIKKKI